MESKKAPNELSAPHSLEDVERLVQRLYLPGPPREISLIQQVLQKLQRSREGWQLADALLQSQDTNVRFFGVLTFNIKINKDWDSLDDETSTALLERLLSWLIHFIAVEEGHLVLRKLCSTLIAYFLQPSVSWDHCVKHVLCCLWSGTVVPMNEVDRFVPIKDIIQQLTASRLTTSLWFIVALAEEVGKTDPESIQTQIYHQSLLSNLDDIVNLLQHVLDRNLSGNPKITFQGVQCYHELVIYAQRVWTSKPETLALLRSLTPQVLLLLDDSETFHSTEEFVTDVLTNFPSFFQTDGNTLIASFLCCDKAQQHMSSLRAGEFDIEPIAFGKILTAFGEATVNDLTSNSDKPHNALILGNLIGLLNSEGCDGFEDDPMCSPALEFWTTYTENLNEVSWSPENKSAWVDRALQYVVRSIEACWAKIRFPSPETAASWSSEDYLALRTFRADVEDLIQSAYPLLGINMLQRFTQLALESLDNQAWLHLEATLFCINALSDCLSEPDSDDESGDESGDNSLSQLFGSSLFAQIGSNVTTIPIKTQQTAVASISRHTAFFERHIEYLPPVLNFLFAAINSPASEIASRSICAICSSCRKGLVGELGAFLQQYEILMSTASIDSGVKERIAGAIAAIIQALPSEEAKLQPLDQLLIFTEDDVQRCLRAEELENARSIGLCALRCLVNMGKGLRVPDDVAINLDDDTPSKVWEQGVGLAIQSRIVNCFSAVIDKLRFDGDIVEATCQILRTGYTENIPGPFVFPYKVTGDIVIGSGLTSARLGYTLETAGIMLSKSGLRDADGKNEAALSLLTHVLHLINLIDRDPGNDPEIASSCIDLAEKLIPRFLKIFLAPSVRSALPSFFSFALICLTSQGILPKRSAAAFWCSLFQMQHQCPEVRSIVENIRQEYGQLLCISLLRGIGGEAVRSELDSLAELLKKIVHEQPNARKWLTEALFNNSFPSQLVSSKDKEIWIQKVIKLRGARRTNRVVKEFWMTCRGTNLAYAS